MQTNPIPPKNWLVESILVTILCCLPAGIVAIVNASKVNSEFAAGNYEGAQKASEEAGKWVKYALIAGGVVVVIYVILFALGIGGAIMGAAN